MWPDRQGSDSNRIVACPSSRILALETQLARATEAQEDASAEVARLRREVRALERRLELVTRPWWWRWRWAW